MKPKSLTATLFALSVLAGACSGGGNAQDSIRAGDAYLKEGKAGEAVIEFRKAVQADQRDGQARKKLGQTLAALGDNERALEHLVRAADLLPDDVDVQLDASRALIAAGRFEDGRTRSDNVLRSQPRNVRAHLLRATATAGLRDMNGAIDTLQEAAKLEPDRAGTLVGLAALQQSQGKLAEAEAGFKQAVTVAPTSVDPRLALAGFYWNTDRRAEAERTLLEALKLEPANVPANLALAGLYRSTNRAAMAEAPLKALAEGGGGSEAKLALADYYIGEKRQKDARPLLESLAGETETAAAARGRLAAIEYDAGKRDVAHKMLDDILAKDPGNASVMVVRGGWQQREGKLADAAATARKAIEVDPKFAEAHVLLGSIFTAQNNVEEAIKSYTAALQLRPSAYTIQVSLAGLHLAAGRTKEAGEFARQAVANAPRVLAPRHALARVQAAEGRLDEADATLRPLLESAPDYTDALSLRALIRLRRGDAAAARQDFARVLQLDPRYVEAVTGLARLDFAEKRPAEATRRVEAALADAPNDPRLLLLLGRSQEARGNLPAAEAAYQRAIDADATLMEAYDALGQLFVRQNKLEPARQAYDKRTQERPTDVGAHTMVARLLYIQGKAAESRARFEKILSIDPRAPIASNNLAYMDAEAGTNLDVALNRAQVAKAALPDDPDIDDTLGWVYVKRGLPALAIDPLEQAVKRGPENPLYHYHLGVAHLKAGDNVRARVSLQKALSLSKNFEGAADAQRQLDSLGR